MMGRKESIVGPQMVLFWLVWSRVKSISDVSKLSDDIYFFSNRYQLLNH
jgi:hypothetical protein